MDVVRLMQLMESKSWIDSSELEQFDHQGTDDFGAP